MSIEDSLQSYLGSQSSVTTLVNQTVSGTVMAAIMPDQSSQKMPFPRIIYVKTGDYPYYSDAGDSGLKEAHFEIECQGLSVSDAEAVRTAVYNTLTAYKGTFGSNTAAAVFIADEYDTFYPAVHGEEQGVKAKTLEVRIFYR